jgi:hypothetical protein
MDGRRPIPAATAGLVTRSGNRFLITLPVVQLKPLTAKLNWRSMLARE